MSIRDILQKLENAEQRFAGTVFLSPIIGNNQITVRIADVICKLQVESLKEKEFTGWAVLRSISTSKAQFIRKATLAERVKYLTLFPRVQFILLQKEKAHWNGMQAHRGDTRFKIDGIVPILLPEEGLNQFESIDTRFDGNLFWFERRTAGSDPSIAAYLRKRLADRLQDLLPPSARSLHKKGLTREQREAYSLMRELLVRSETGTVEVRLSKALTHGQATLRSYTERGDTYSVEYDVDGVRHRSVVNKSDLTVLTAGICLAGEDQKFDLTSLVSVLREANKQD